MSGIPIVCLGCNDRAEIPFIPPDLTCLACKTGDHIDLDDRPHKTAYGEHTISRDCARGGSGECDGTECDCPCHGPTGEGMYGDVGGEVGVDGYSDSHPLPNDIEGVKAWHDGMYAALDAYDPAYAGSPHPFGGYHVRIVGGKQAGIIQDPSLSMPLLPSGVPEQDQDVDLLRESDQPRKVVVPKGSAPYSQRALAAGQAGPCGYCGKQVGAGGLRTHYTNACPAKPLKESSLDRAFASLTRTAAEDMVCPDCNGAGAVPAGGGEDPDDVDNGYVRCGTCNGSGMVPWYDDSHPDAWQTYEGSRKQADLTGIKAELARSNGQRVVVSYTTDLGMRDDSGTLSYDGTTATLLTSHGTLALKPGMILSVSAVAGDWADTRTDLVDASAVTWMQNFPSGATAKVRQIAASIVATNPGIDRREALRVATETVRRYPKVAGSNNDMIRDIIRRGEPWNGDCPNPMCRDGIHLECSGFQCDCPCHPWLEQGNSMTARKTAMPSPAAHGVDVGAVFVSSWGYDQTNIDFYVVTEVLGASVRVRQCGQFVEHKGSGHDAVTPDVSRYMSEPMLKRLQVMDISGKPEPYININSYSNARLWDGSPKYQTASGWGH